MRGTPAWVPPALAKVILNFERINEKNNEYDNKSVNGQRFYHGQTDNQGRHDLTRHARVSRYTFECAFYANALTYACSKSCKAYCKTGTEQSQSIIAAKFTTAITAGR